MNLAPLVFPFLYVFIAKCAKCVSDKASVTMDDMPLGLVELSAPDNEARRCSEPCIETHKLETPLVARQDVAPVRPQRKDWSGGAVVVLEEPDERVATSSPCVIPSRVK